MDKKSIFVTRLKYFSFFCVSINWIFVPAVIPYFAIIACASATVEESSTVGPDAIISMSSSGTSEAMREMTSAGYAATASAPPRAREVCLRTVLISCIGAPRAVSSLKSSLSSEQVVGASGRQSKVEPPPEISIMTRSLSSRPERNSTMRVVACTFASLGKGCVPVYAVILANRSLGAEEVSRAMPAVSAPPRSFSMAAATTKAHLPTPTKYTRLSESGYVFSSMCNPSASTRNLFRRAAPTSMAASPASAIASASARTGVVASASKFCIL